VACYCGVTLFGHYSETSFKEKTRVRHFANKSIKKLLHLLAMSAIQTDEELKMHYQCKVAESKNKMLVINAVRNKILHRLCAAIKRGTPFQQEYQLA